MSVIDKAISDVMRVIPRQILQVAFLGDIGIKSKLGQDIKWHIRNKIIDNWVRPDCDLIGAYQDNIPLAGCEATTDDMYRITVRIPKSLTGGRSIIQALALNYIYNVPGGMVNNGWQNNSMNMNTSGNSPVMNTAARILRSASPAPIQSTAAVQMIGENVVLITDYIGSIAQCSLTCRLSHDREMTNVTPGGVKQFCKLVILATKAWIYNETVIDLDMGYLYKGMEVGRVREIIDSYADSAELYSEFLEEYRGVGFMMDPNRHSTWLRVLVSGKS